jgi:hypothetical protein
MAVENQDQITHFQQRLQETRAWCASQDWSVNPAEGLRTAFLCPSEQASIEQTFHDYGEFWKKTPQHRQEIVEYLAFKRATLLQQQGIPCPQFAKHLSGGRLLAFTPDGTLSDGAATVATQGFFDWDNMAAWDTWIWYVTNDPVNNLPWWRGCDSFLLTWVPTVLVKVVEAGIDVNPEECIRWASDLDTAFIRQLRQGGLIL